MNFRNQLLENSLENSSYRDNIWGVDLADMQSLSKYNEGIRYLLCVIDLFSKYAWVIPLKDKKGASIVNSFKEILSNSNTKPNKIWVDQGSEFYNKSFKDFLKINNIKMYSTYNERKSVVGERFIRTLKNKLFKNITSIQQNIHFDIHFVDKYNNTVHKTIQMKPIEVTDDSYAEYNETENKKILNLKLVTMLEFQNIKTFLLKDILQIGQRKFLLLMKLKIQFLGLMLLVI